jgi:hypothetical protein
VVGGMALHIRKPNGMVLTVPSWQAFRTLAHLHCRRPCQACSGEGRQAWLIEASGGMPSRWYATPCKRCGGKGWRY